MSAYESLAAAYDALTGDVNYEAIAQFVGALLKKTRCEQQTMVDLACGTGSLSVLFAKQGWQVTGVDLSEEMLTQAWEKVDHMEGNRPFFVCQAMQALALPEPVDCVVCCLDSINYLIDPADCKETFQRVFQALKHGGAFVFDINTPRKLRNMDGQIFLDEQENAFCVWQAEFDEEENICYYGIDLFTSVGTLWDRTFEEHREYAYAPEDLTLWLQEAGFDSVSQFSDCRLESPKAEEERIYFLAIKE